MIEQRFREHPKKRKKACAAEVIKGKKEFRESTLKYQAQEKVKSHIKKLKTESISAESNISKNLIAYLLNTKIIIVNMYSFSKRWRPIKTKNVNFDK